MQSAWKLAGPRARAASSLAPSTVRKRMAPPCTTKSTGSTVGLGSSGRATRPTRTVPSSCRAVASSSTVERSWGSVTVGLPEVTEDDPTKRATGVHRAVGPTLPGPVSPPFRPVLVSDTVGSWMALVHDLYPPHHAAAWDNVGLQVGEPDWPVERVLVALDVTGRVVTRRPAAPRRWCWPTTRCCSGRWPG